MVWAAAVAGVCALRALRAPAAFLPGAWPGASWPAGPQLALTQAEHSPRHKPCQHRPRHKATRPNIRHDTRQRARRYFQPKHPGQRPRHQGSRQCEQKHDLCTCRAAARQGKEITTGQGKRNHTSRSPQGFVFVDTLC